MSEFDSLVLKRQSTRRYQPGRRIDRAVLDECLNCARLAPSACNSQPWRFTVVDTPEGIARVAPAVQDSGMNRFAGDCSALIVVTEAPVRLLESLAVPDAEQQKFAPIDIGLAVADLTLACAERGIATCILGWINEKTLRDALPLPEDETIRLVLTLGFAPDGYPIRTKTRLPLDAIRRYAE